jgi:tetratricopeptide (TPR) repeat protein/predicted aspartyl protease
MALIVQLPSFALGAECKLARFVELPVTMDGTRPTITAQINGTDALFTLDSGAFWSMLTPAAAEQYKLHPDKNRVPGLSVVGVGGRSDVAVATVTTFTIFGVPLHKVDFLVGGNDPGQGTVGLLGQNLLRIADVEYDLAQGVLRFFRAKDCRQANLAYWAKPGSAYSVMDIEAATPLSPHTIGVAYLNGAKLRVTFDTGASSSIVGLRAAAKAGIKPGNPGVESAGDDYGVGRRRIDTWIATFPSLKVGDEEVRNARLRFGDLGELDMLLGADFFLSHRIYVASSQGKLYFTYNGGPVFNLTPPPISAKSTGDHSSPDVGAPVTARSPTSDLAPDSAPFADSSLTTALDSAPAALPAASAVGAPADAAGFARRGAAFASRRDFEHALLDFNRACELAPNEPSYYYRRGMVRYFMRQPEQGASDIDQALKLKPDYVDALMARAQIQLHEQNPTAAVADLDAVDRVVPKEANVRLQLAGLYEDASRLPAAITQLDVWISVHSQDISLSQALNERCWDRALLGQELDRALKDCNAALRLDAHSPALLDSRGFVHLRSGEFEKAIADYDAALKIHPKQAWSLYCRGVAKLRTGKIKEGEADIAAAVAIDPHLAERAKQYDVGA